MFHQNPLAYVLKKGQQSFSLCTTPELRQQFFVIVTHQKKFYGVSNLKRLTFRVKYTNFYYLFAPSDHLKSRCAKVHMVCSHGVFALYGAESRARTGDLLFTKQLLYQLSYFGTKSRATIYYTKDVLLSSERFKGRMSVKSDSFYYAIFRIIKFMGSKPSNLIGGFISFIYNRVTICSREIDKCYMVMRLVHTVAVQKLRRDKRGKVLRLFFICSIIEQNNI